MYNNEGRTIMNHLFFSLYSACPDGYSLFNGNCYGGLGRGAVNWNDARAACVELTERFSSFHLSFDLLSIHSYDENMFIYNNITNGEFYHFVGLKRNANESEFKWFFEV